MKTPDMDYLDITASINDITFYGIASAMRMPSDITPEMGERIKAARAELVASLIEHTKKIAPTILGKHMVAAPSIEIRAEVHSDDRVMFTNFDAAPYFLTLTDNGIMDIIEAGYSGDESTDNIAIEYPLPNTFIEGVMSYVDMARKIRDMGFEVSVVDTDVLEWVRHNRPNLIPRIVAWYRTNEDESWEYPML